MDEINYLRIAHILGGTLREVEVPQFGAFSAGRASAERFRAIRTSEAKRHFTEAEMKAIAKAFEEVRQGFEVDRLLVDPKLQGEFLTRVRRYGVKAPATAINKRLQGLRKYPAYGIRLKRTTRGAELDPNPHLYVAELAFMQLRYRRKVSVDDIVTDAEIGQEFAAICKTIDPNAPPILLKWALICMRKARALDARRTERILSLEPELIEDRLELVGKLDTFKPSAVPNERGLFTLHEDSERRRYLYVGVSDDLRASVEPFQDAMPFIALSGPFWQPKPEDIELRLTPLPKKWAGGSVRDWSFRLIEEKHPLFNLPVDFGTAHAA